MKAERIPDPTQGVLNLIDPDRQNKGAIPEPYPEGPNTKIIEGLTVLYKAISDIAQAHRNQSFVKLPEGTRAVKKFAEKLDTSTDEAQKIVARTIDRDFGKKRLTHYDTAGHRLVTYRNKQVKRTLLANEQLRLVDPDLIRSMLPESFTDLEHRFFHADSPEEERLKERRRQKIAAFVRRHS